MEAQKKKEERSASLTLMQGEDLTPKLLTKLRQESLHSTSPKEALMSAISASFQDLSQLGETGEDAGDLEGHGLAPELVVEVNSVLSKLMNSLNENLDPELIPTIKDLQATLNSKKKRVELESRFRRQCPSQDPSTSKVPWKIRAARKRAIKHHTTGMTNDEFQLIKNSLQESAKSFTSIPTRKSYALSRNKSESAIRSLRGGDLTSEPFHKELRSVLQHQQSSDSKNQTLSVTANGTLDPRPSDLGYASDVCDYNVNSFQGASEQQGAPKTSSTPQEAKTPESSSNPSSCQTAEETSNARNSEKPPRRSMKSSSVSAVKARIDRRKRMRHANAIDNPHGSLSDQESSMIEDDDDDEEEESEDTKQGTKSGEESTVLEPNKASLQVSSSSTNYNSSSSELTPETHRRKNWNSRFSNIKNAFVSEEEIFYKSRSPSINRDNTVAAVTQGKKADDKYMNIVVQARLENSHSSNSRNPPPKPNGNETSRGRTTERTKSRSVRNQSLNNASSLSSGGVSSSKSKQPTPKSPPRLSKSLPKESRAEAMGLEPSNKNRNDMDYQEYMSIISRVRRTKESTRVRTEQIRLASMYAQEKRRQEEIKREEERLKLESEKVQKDLERQKQEEQRLESQKVQESKSSSDSFQTSPDQKEEGTNDSTDSKKETPVPVVSPLSAKQTSLSSFKPDSPASSPRDSSTPLVDKDNEKVITRLHEQARLEKMRVEQKRQQELREEQVKAEQEKLERLRQEQIRQEKEREEIHRLEYERLKQIQEEQRKLDEERRRQQERIRLEQVRLEEERKRQETLQAERNAEYNRQRLDMEAQNVCLPQETRAKLLMSPAMASSAPPVSIASSTPQQSLNMNLLSPEEKIIQKRLSDQETLRKSHKAEESKIRQEKLKLTQQEEMLISRQEEMLRQVESERQNLLKQEQLIRSRQQGRLTQVRQEKMLLEKQEEMLQMRETQLIEERTRQEKLRMEQKSLREQEEVIRKRQEQISKELMGDMGNNICSSENFPSSQSNDPTGQMNGEEDEDDTLDEDSDEEEFYESTVEVKQKSTSVPTSVRTVAMANTDDKPWAPITPYLSTYEQQNSQINNPTPPSEMFDDDDGKQSLYKPGIITSPESLRTSSTLITTPDETSLQLSLDGSSSLSATPPPLVPPLPYDEVFRPVQPQLVHPTNINSSLYNTMQASSPHKKTLTDNYKPSPKIGGPGSAFKPYSSSENLHDPSLFPSIPDPTNNLLLPPTYPSSSIALAPSLKKPAVYNKVKELRRPIRAPFSTTDTEPEMKECHFPPEKNKRTSIKQHPYKPSYSTSETEDETYLARRTKWSRHHHNNHNHSQGAKNNHASGSSWDPFQIESPPQITQKPVGIIQKPKPQHQYHPSTVTLGVAPIPATNVTESLYNHHPIVIERGAEIPKEYALHLSSLLINAKQDNPPGLVSLTSLGNFPIPPSLPEVKKPPITITSQSNQHHNLLKNNVIRNEQKPPDPPKEAVVVSSKAISFESDLKALLPMNSSHEGRSPNNDDLNNNNLPPIKDVNGNVLFEPSKVLRQSSFTNLPSRSSVTTNENIPRQSSFNSIERKLSSVVRTEPELEPSSFKKASQLQVELEKKLEERKISKEERLRKQTKEELANGSILLPLTVVEMNSQGQHKPSSKVIENHQEPGILPHRRIHESVSGKKDQEVVKKKTVLPRNNLTITAMEIMTRKEIKTCEMEERLMREKYGQPSDQSPSDSAKKQGSALLPKVGNNSSKSMITSNKPPVQAPPKIILKKEPKRLEPEEIRARKSSMEKQQDTSKSPSIEHKKEARVVSASNVITRSNNGVVEKKKEEYIVNLSKSSSAEDMHDDSRAAKIKREKVKKAAERFEKTASPISGSKVNQTAVDKLPWNDETTPSPGKPKPGILRRRETFRKNGYALRMSKSSDSITASKMMSKNNSGLNINQYSNSNSDTSSDVYHKTRDEIRKILTIAKQSSVTERIKIFNNQILGEVRSIDEEDRDRKAEAIKKEILAAKMSAVDENEESSLPNRKLSLQIPQKNPSSESRLRINQPPGSDASKLKIGRKLSEPALNGSVKSRVESYMGAKSSGKKEPKLIMNSQTHLIYAQSATDYSATEEETDHREVHCPSKDYLQVPNAPNKKRGLRRSKSFASSGQYECVLSDEEIDEKTRQMMAFFNTTSTSSNSQQQIRVISQDNGMKPPLKGVLKTRQQSISEEIIGDEDLGNVDDIFEKLLVENDVEKEVLGGVVSRSSSGFVRNSASSSSVGGVSNEHLASGLPPTHGKRIHRHHQGRGLSWGTPGGSREHLSSSPTQSEYESCDPWEDY